MRPKAKVIHTHETQFNLPQQRLQNLLGSCEDLCPPPLGAHNPRPPAPPLLTPPSLSGARGRSWLQHLDPSLNKGPWTEEEDNILCAAQLRVGNQWDDIAKLLKGRTGKSAKRRWHAIARRNACTQRRDDVPNAAVNSGGDARSGGGLATTSPRPGDVRGVGCYRNPTLDVVPRGGGGGGACPQVGRAGGSESPRASSGSYDQGVGSLAAPVYTLASAAPPAAREASSPVLVPISSFPLGITSPAAEEGARWQVCASDSKFHNPALSL